MSKYLVFGASGALGAATVELLRNQGHDVLTAGRQSSAAIDVGVEAPDWQSRVKEFGPLDGVVWAQGINASGTVITSSTDDLRFALEANVVFIQETLQVLVNNGLLARPCRSVVVSSIWQDHARSNKFAYMVSKSALAGLVKSIALDLAGDGFAINAVLPGVIDTPMTRANLSAEQIDRMESNSLGGALAKPESIAETISWLLSPHSVGMNAQFVTVDEGWTTNRHV